jgi:hypothetical protein
MVSSNFLIKDFESKPFRLTNAVVLWLRGGSLGLSGERAHLVVLLSGKSLALKPG